MRTIVGLYDSFGQAQGALRDLEAAGFTPNQVNVIARGDVVSGADTPVGSATGAGTAIGAGLGLLAGLSMIAVPGIGAIAALGPILAGGILGAVAGGLVGSLVDAGVPMNQAEYYSEGVRRGGTLVTVAASDDDAPRAVYLLARHDPVNIDERVLQWRQSGWTPGQAAAAGADSNAHPAEPSPSAPAASPVIPDVPDPTGHTTMGDAADNMPTLEIPPATVLSPAPDLQPTRELSNPGASPANRAEEGEDVFVRIEAECREDFERHSPDAAQWDERRPAYRHGCGLACECHDPKAWDDVEPEAKTRWERSNPSTWDRVKDAARYGYDRARSRL